MTTRGTGLTLGQRRSLARARDAEFKKAVAEAVTPPQPTEEELMRRHVVNVYRHETFEARCKDHGTLGTFDEYAAADEAMTSHFTAAHWNRPEAVEPESADVPLFDLEDAS